MQKLRVLVWWLGLAFTAGLVLIVGGTGSGRPRSAQLSGASQVPMAVLAAASRDGIPEVHGPPIRPAWNGTSEACPSRT